MGPDTEGKREGFVPKGDFVWKERAFLWCEITFCDFLRKIFRMFVFDCQFVML